MVTHIGNYRDTKHICLIIWSLALPVAQLRLLSLSKYSAGITRIHNHYRHRESASNMEMMVWDKYLANRAAAWARKCYWGHERKGLGENLSYRWSSLPLKAPDVIIRSIRDWYNEKKSWRWSTACGAACHYTQIVWAKTSKVGCAYNVCANLRTNGRPVKNAHYLVCFYDPPGNWLGQYPYRHGSHCSNCQNKQVCRGGLCCSNFKPKHSVYLPLINSAKKLTSACTNTGSTT